MSWMTGLALQADATTVPGTDAGISRPPWLPGWVPTWLVQLALALAVVVVSYYVSRLVRESLARRIARRFRRPSVTRTVLRTVQTAILLVGAFVALNVLGIQIGNIALSVTVFSAVLGFVLAPIIGSIINGLFVLSENAYEVGDMIELDNGTRGFVEDITLRYTKVFTLDNTFTVIPNGTMRERDVVNYSAEDARTRLSLDVLVTYESDIEEARRLIERAAREVENVIEGGPDIRIGSARYPAAPTCYIETFGDHGVNLRLRYWATEPYKLLTLRSRVQTNVWDALEDANVEIAYPHSHLVFDETSGQLQVGLSEGEYPPSTGVRAGLEADPESGTDPDRATGPGPGGREGDDQSGQR